MKKIVILILVLISMSVTKVHASVERFYVGEWIYGVYVKNTKPGGIYNYELMSFTRRVSDDMYVYCIEPGVPVENWASYVGNNIDYSNNDLERANLIAYYGYGYAGHSDSKWYAITQKMIWQTVNKEWDTYYTDTLNGNRITRFTEEENEINNLIANHNIKPSFDSMKFSFKEGDVLDLNDNNSILSNYDVISNNALINGNKINFKDLVPGVNKIILEKKDKRFDVMPIIYRSNNSQDLISFGSYQEIRSLLEVYYYDGEVVINKIGEELILENNSYKYNKVPLADVHFDVYTDEDIIINGELKYNKGDLVTNIITDHLGQVRLRLFPGKYYLVETKSSLDNMILEEWYYFTFSYEYEGILEIEIENKLPKGELSFVKIDEDTEVPLEGVEIGIYTDDDILIYKGNTNENGEIKLDDLFISNYYIKELTPLNGYQLNEEELYFTIEMDGDKKDVIMTNKRIYDVPDTLKNSFDLKFVSLFSGISFMTCAKRRKILCFLKRVLC